MLDVLLESRQHGVGGNRLSAAASAIAHASLIGGAVLATMPVERTPRVHVPQDTVIYIAPSVPAPRVVTERGNGVAVEHPRLILQRLPRIPDIGSVTPDVDATATFDPRKLWRDVGGISSTPHPSGGGDSGIYTDAAVDRIVSPMPQNGEPPYPAALRAAGIEGEVSLRFVVDTTGRAEPASIHVLASTHELFSDAVRRWIAKTRYIPAEVHGRRVRQLVEQRVGFTLRR